MSSYTVITADYNVVWLERSAGQEMVRSVLAPEMPSLCYQVAADSKYPPPRMVSEVFFAVSRLKTRIIHFVHL